VRAGGARVHVLAALVGLLGASAAGAQDLGFSLAGGGARPYFTFVAGSGRTLTGHVQVVSRSGRAHRVVLEAADVGTAATGGLDYRDGAPRATARWLRLDRRRLTLPAGQAVSVPFAVHVPAGAQAGDHVAGVVATDPTELVRQRRAARRGGQALRLAFRSRLAIAVVVRVPGPRRPSLAFDGAAVDASPAGVRIALRLRNRGNTLIKPTRGDVTVSQDGQAILTTGVDLDTFAPASEIRFPIPLPGMPTQGRYHVAGTLHPNGAPPVRIDTDVEFSQRQAQRFARETGRPVHPGGGPPWLVIALALASLMAAGFAAAYLRARRQLRGEGRPA
jgi:hypothetical protein